MPPRNTKSDKTSKDSKTEVKAETKHVKDTKTKEIKETKPVKDTKTKDSKSKLKTNEVGKWAEVTDDDYHHTDIIEETKSKSLGNDSSDSHSISSSNSEEVIIKSMIVKSPITKLNTVEKQPNTKFNHDLNNLKEFTKSKPSIIDFDYDEIHIMDLEELSEFDTNTLLKVLMVRGTKTNNPVLWAKTKTLLKLLNFELEPRLNFNRNYSNKKYNKPTEEYELNKTDGKDFKERGKKTWRGGKN